MNGDKLQIHESTKVVYEGKTYYFCSQKCFNHLVKHFLEVTIIGLKERGKLENVYFKNKEKF